MFDADWTLVSAAGRISAQSTSGVYISPNSRSSAGQRHLRLQDDGFRIQFLAGAPRGKSTWQYGM